MSGDPAWERAHRIAGWTLIATGMALAVAGWLRTAVAVWGTLAILVVGLLAATWVSYQTWREDPSKQGSP